MTSFPLFYSILYPTVNISTISLNGLGSIATGSFTNGVSTTWPTSNLAIFTPFRIPQPIVVTKLWADNGGVVSGNMDLGIYDATGTKIVSSGSTAQANINTIQTFDITDTEIGPGLFYLAMAMDNTTGTNTRFAGANTTLAHLKMFGMAEQTTAFVLPATATFATASNIYVPNMGLSTALIL